LRTCPTAPRIASGRGSHTDVPYDRSSRKDDAGRKGVLCIRNAFGNSDVCNSYGGPVPRDACDLPAAFPLGVFLIRDSAPRNACAVPAASPPDVSGVPCPVRSYFAILSDCLFP